MQTPPPSRPAGTARFDAVALLRQSAIFRDLEPTILLELARGLKPQDLKAGQSLISEGDRSEDAWFVISGRLEITTTSDEEELVVAELGSGSIVGEMSLLTGSPRSASVRAIRHSRVLRLPHEHVRAIIFDDPPALLEIARSLIERLDESIHDNTLSAHSRVVAVVPAGGDPSHRSFAGRLAATVGPFNESTVVDRRQAEGALGIGYSDAELLEYLNRVEMNHDLTILVADEDHNPWTSRCIAEADLVLLTGRHERLSSLSAAEATYFANAGRSRRQPAHLVVLHDTPGFSGTTSLLDGRRVDRHHHVVTSSPATLQRLARVIAGTTVGLVLGGGGARGFAHLGVVKALIEAGIPIDHVGGTSIGASMAGIYAMGWDVPSMVEQERIGTVDHGSLIDFSFPALALARGGRLTEGLRTLYGETMIEDLLIDFFCVATDLTDGGVRTQQRGPLWRAVRSSVAIPGIFPPVRSQDHHVLVDGGVLNNLPTDVMRQLFQPATIIASDLRGSTHLPADDLSADGIVSGWQIARRKISPMATTMKIPRMIDVLTSATAVTGIHRDRLADLVFRPPVEPFALLEFAAYETIVETGYHHAVDVLAAWERPEQCGPLLSADEIKARLAPPSSKRS